MRMAYAVALVCATVAAGAGELRGQSMPVKSNVDMSSPKLRTTVTRKGGGRGRMQRLQQEGIAAARKAERLAHGGSMNPTEVRRDALDAQKDLQTVMKQLEASAARATGAEKQHLSSIHEHEQEALTHADQLVGEAEKPKPDRSAIASHAQGVIQHAQVAEKLMTTVAATDSWINQ